MTVLDDFLAQYPPGSRRVYASTLRDFERVTGCPADNATQADLLAYQRAQEGASPSTAGRKFSTLSALYRYLQRRGIRTDNPMAAVDVRRYKVDRLATVRDLTPASVQRLYGAVQSPREAALLVVLLHGLRISEAVALDVEQFRGGAIERIPGKGGKYRSLPIIDGWPIIAEYIGARRSGPLFRTKARGRLSARQARNIIYRLSERAGARIHPHMLRHTFGAMMLRQGVGLAHLQDMMGHASPDTTRVYSRLTIEDLKAATQGVRLLGEPAAQQSKPRASEPALARSHLRIIEGGGRHG